MKKRSLLFASVLVIGMGMSMSAWAEGSADQHDNGLGGLLSSLFSDGGVVDSLLGEDGAVSNLLGDEEAKEAINDLFGENGALAGILPEDVDINGVLESVGSQLEDANSSLYQGISNVVEMVSDEAGSVDWDKVGDSVEDLIGMFSGSDLLGALGGGTGEEMSQEELDAYIAELMIPYDKADAVMFDYVAERNAEFMDAGDVQVFSKKTGYMDDIEQDEVKVLADFTQVNFAIDGEQMNMVSVATDTMLLTLTKGEDGEFTVTDEKHAADGEEYSASVEALCEEVGIEADEFYSSCVFGAYNDADALGDYLDEHPEIKTAEFQGEQMTAEELHKLSSDYINDLLDAAFEDTEEEESVTEGAGEAAEEAATEAVTE